MNLKLLSVLIVVLYGITESRAQGIPLPNDVGQPTRRNRIITKKQFDYAGYIENTTTVEYQNAQKKETLLNMTRAKLSISGEPSKSIDFSIGLIGDIYSGQTELLLLDYLPSDQKNEAWSETAYRYQLDNQIYLQEAFATLYLDHGFLRVGRQKYYFGTGYAYNPTDLFNTKNPLDPSYESDGLDLLLVHLDLPYSQKIDAGMNVGSELDTSNYFVKNRALLGDVEYTLMYVRYNKERIDYEAFNELDPVSVETALAAGDTSLFDLEEYKRSAKQNLFAVSANGELGGVHLYGEGGYIFLTRSSKSTEIDELKQNHELLLLGIDYTFDFQLYAIVEYFRSGAGESEKDHITFNDSMAYLNGEITTYNRDTLFSGISYPVYDLTELSLFIISSFNESLYLCNPQVSVNVADSTFMLLNVYTPLGLSSQSTARSGGFIRLKFNF